MGKQIFHITQVMHNNNLCSLCSKNHWIALTVLQSLMDGRIQCYLGHSCGEAGKHHCQSPEWSMHRSESSWAWAALTTNGSSSSLLGDCCVYALWSVKSWFSSESKSRRPSRRKKICSCNQHSHNTCGTCGRAWQIQIIYYYIKAYVLQTTELKVEPSALPRYVVELILDDAAEPALNEIAWGWLRCVGCWFDPWTLSTLASVSYCCCCMRRSTRLRLLWNIIAMVFLRPWSFIQGDLTKFRTFFSSLAPRFAFDHLSFSSFFAFCLFRSLAKNSYEVPPVVPLVC